VPGVVGDRHRRRLLVLPSVQEKGWEQLESFWLLCEKWQICSLWVGFWSEKAGLNLKLKKRALGI
jgi:AMMECR1 domain-containing protein